MTLRRWFIVFAGLSVIACGGRTAPPAALTPKAPSGAPAPPPASADGSRTDSEAGEPIVPPPLALLAGLMPLTATGVD